MTLLLQFASAYLGLNLLVMVASTIAVGVSLLNRRLRRLSFGCELRFHYALLLAATVLGFLRPLFPGEANFSPVVHVWAARSIKAFDAGQKMGSAASSSVLALAPAQTALADASASATLSFALVLGLLFVALFRHLQAVRRLRALAEHATTLRHIGRVHLLCRDELSIPLSFRTFGKVVVAVPTWLLTSPRSLQLALGHELQHHRQFDTIMAHFYTMLRNVLLLNPMIHVWISVLQDLQEYACDEALIGRKSVSTKAYIGCLLEVAEVALGARGEQVCAPGSPLIAGRNTLKRRLELMQAMSSFKNGVTGRAAVLGLGVLASLALLGTARIAHGLVQDHRISRDQAMELVSAQSHSSPFRIVINDAVLGELNRYLGTIDGRRFVSQTLVRKREFDSIVQPQLANAGVPAEFAAVPFVESGYRNRRESAGKPGWGAGLWMFIRETAQSYGLRVDDTVDQRLDPVLETGAAMRLLTANYGRFGSWELSLLAYNVGERKVEAAMEQTGSRDVWALIEAGAVNDRNYVAKVMAAALIIAHPQLIE